MHVIWLSLAFACRRLPRHLQRCLGSPHTDLDAALPQASPVETEEKQPQTKRHSGLFLRLEIMIIDLQASHKRPRSSLLAHGCSNRSGTSSDDTKRRQCVLLLPEARPPCIINEELGPQAF